MTQVQNAEAAPPEPSAVHDRAPARSVPARIWAGTRQFRPVLLLLIRPLACAVALRATDMTPRERLWVGWFGVRGVGSLFYAAVAVEAGVLAAGEADTVMWTTVAVVGSSIVVHGVTGTPLTRRLERGPP